MYDFIIEGNDLVNYKPSGIYIDKYGIQFVFHFSNKYGASLVTSDAGLWEIAVLDKNGDVTSKTPVTDDVIGFDEYTYRIEVEPSDIFSILRQIDNLEEEKHD